MQYRRGYHKKDGTYVQGHYVKSKTKEIKEKRGCLGLLGFLVFMVGTIVYVI